MDMFESRISAGATEELPGWDKHHAKIVAWSHDMEEHAEQCVERHCELAKQKRRSNFSKFQVLAWMIITSRRINLNLLENCQQIVLKYLYLAQMVRPDIYSEYTNWHDQSQNGHKLATEDWQD